MFNVRVISWGNCFFILFIVLAWRPFVLGEHNLKTTCAIEKHCSGGVTRKQLRHKSKYTGLDGAFIDIGPLFLYSHEFHFNVIRLRFSQHIKTNE